jgi:response regulator RpfG family c-di-GMP phosphodiesterase
MHSGKERDACYRTRRVSAGSKFFSGKGNAMSKNILCLDDDINTLDVMKRFLSREYCVVCADSGDTALRLLDEMDIDMILSDFNMPQMSGLEFLALARQKQPRTRRILVSGGVDPRMVEDSMAEGLIHKFIAKPWRSTELSEALQDMFNGSHI